MHFVFYTTLLSQVGIYRRKDHSLQRLELGKKNLFCSPRTFNRCFIYKISINKRLIKLILIDLLIIKIYPGVKNAKIVCFLNYFVRSVVKILISHAFFRVLFTGPIIVVHNQNARGKKNNLESFFQNP
jgi:hypothetical protein